MLKVNNLTKKYGKLEVLKDISFEVGKGKVYGFLGENGAGKTTTMNILTGLIEYDEGEIFLDGKNFMENKREILRKVGYLPQSPVFYGYMTAYEYLKFIGEISGMPKDKIDKRIKELIEIVGLKDSLKRKVGQYSGGMKQRFGLAVSLFNSPEILILDEPTSALDPQGRLEVIELMEKLKDQGTTIFLSTHILNDIERVCDEVSILHKGKIILSDNLEKIKNSYIQPIYDIEFEEDCEGIVKAMSGIDFIKDIKYDKNKASIYVNDLNRAKTELLKIIASYNVPITAFVMRKSTLEDIFIRMVQENVNL